MTRRSLIIVDHIDGFSLVELVIVILVLTLASVPVLGRFTQVAGSLSINEELQVAAQLAQERAEQVLATRRLSGYAAVAVGTTTDTLGGNYAAYGRSVTVTTYGGSACPVVNCKQVAIAVTNGATNRASIDLLLAEY